MLAQLADRFVLGELHEAELGALRTIELERDEHGAVFAFHVWPDLGFDGADWTRVLGAPTRKPRLGPDDPDVWQFLHRVARGRG